MRVNTLLAEERCTIHRATLEDFPFIKRVQDEVLLDTRDDLAPRVADVQWNIVLTNPLTYVLVPSFGDCIGVFLLHPWNTVTYELHSAILPLYRGWRSVIAAREMGIYMFTNTLCRKIVTQIPTFNYPAKSLAIRCGMKREGLNRRSYLKNGTLHDQYIYGICREEVICQ